MTDTNDCFLMGRMLTKAMGYIDYPEILPPVKVNQNSQTSIKTAQVQLSESNTFLHFRSSNQNQTCNKFQNRKGKNTKSSKIRQSTNIQTPQQPRQVHGKLYKGPEDSKITFGHKTHNVPTTKEYIMKEYADIFQGIGTLPGPPYHIELKDEYTPVRHATWSIPVGMQEVYKAELDRLVREEVIIEVDHYMEWVNPIVPAQKPDGKIRLH